MGSPGIIEAVDVATKRGAGLGNVSIGARIDLLIFDRPPKPLDKDIVPPRALAVHAAPLKSR